MEARSKLNGTIFLLLLLPAIAWAQEPPFDTVESEQVWLNSEITYGDSVSDVTSILGDPEDIEEYYVELADVTETQYRYGDDLMIAFVDEKVERINVKTSAHTLCLEGFELQVGNHIDSIESAFPKSYGLMNTLNEAEATAIGLDYGDYYYLEVRFDDEGTITEVRHLMF
ncbi:MAG: hypothetical protein PPP56_07345 [Longimonas sp.]|uniref:hypothetical protein n=1 Tax=Longimonas sp. TaxID=2039626 RepID=UPI003360DDB2